ncbi:diguanylate cyclase with PAS/PAC sensor [Desulfovibrio sp. X2]|uniref:sensor domain-containing diguanylate cyclase n=1 Tax=Desulfovibrio sp. X2 TaxID=941449 RepID=UPI000358B4F2|nr:sensor domain-containing diguanylate cyclase [Desulfovibrio sp. X2]EPR44683.1 diguanylate cyclase with PAS/PAC sensor [Desulfovibrio sp. X2]
MEFECMSLEDLGIEGVQQLLYVERYAWLSLSPDMAAVISLDGMFEDCNTHWENQVGYPREVLQGGYLVEYIHFDDRERALAEMQKLVTSDIGSANLSFRFLSHDGDFHRLGLNVVYSPFHEAYFCTGRDLDRVQAADSTRLAYRDALTGLGNRLRLEEDLPRALAQAKNQGTVAAVVFIDLDGFKNVNDTLGHRGGDSLLVRVGERMAHCLGDIGRIYRQGGDEFVALLPLCEGRDKAEQVARLLVECLQPAFLVNDLEVRVGASLGVALYPHDAQDTNGLLEKADLAMYRVKKAGKNAFAFHGDTAQTCA